MILGERYRLTELLATGGMGEIWRATDEVLDRLVAVKVLRAEFVSDAEARNRFAAEARFAASLQHGGIAQVYDYGEHGEQAYLVMELVDGESLSEILARSGPLSSEVTLDIVAQAARALQAAHAAGIIHRDVKPGNLMVTAGGTVKITDFGIAKGLRGSSNLTQTNMVMGTAHYVSPEQASGQPLTASSDIYSLGVVAYECLAGRPPFDAEAHVAVALKHVREEPPPLSPDIPAPVRELTGQMLAKDPSQRPRHAHDVADRAYVIRETIAMGATSFQDTDPALIALAGSTGELPADMTVVDRLPTGPEVEVPATGILPAGGIDDTARPDPGRRPGVFLLVASIGAAILVLGFIMVGNTLLPSSADPVDNSDPNVPPNPASSSTTKGPRTKRPTPTSAVPTFSRTTTPGTPKPTTTKPTTTPKPKPTPSTPTPTPSSPTPRPSPSGN